MRLLFWLAVAAAAAILFLGCGSTEEVSQNDLQALASSPAVATPTATPSPTPPASATPVPTDTPAPTASAAPDATLTYTDAEHGFSLQYPAFWTVSEAPVSADLAELDVLKITEFFGKDDLARVRFFVSQNPKGLSLMDWIAEHNPIFLDTPPQEVTIGGLPGFFQPLGVHGPSPHAYLLSGPLVLNFGGLTDDDYEVIQSSLQFD